MTLKKSKCYTYQKKDILFYMKKYDLDYNEDDNNQKNHQDNLHDLVNHRNNPHNHHHYDPHRFLKVNNIFECKPFQVPYLE